MFHAHNVYIIIAIMGMQVRATLRQNTVITADSYFHHTFAQFVGCG